MNVQENVLSILDQVLGLKGRSASFEATTALLGAVPELDSMAAVAVLTELENYFGFTIEDDDIDGETFSTVGSLVSFVENKLATA